MPLFDRFRRRLADRIAPEAPDSRRTFFRHAAGAGAAMLGAGLMLPDEAWAGVEERAARFGITPGTVVDAQGRPVKSRGTDPFIGEIAMFGGNFAPCGWANCDGQLLNISSYSALFSLFGTMYGGDGEVTFGLPDLRGRFPMHVGNGPGLTPRPFQGVKSGAETALATNVPAHSHSHSHAQTGTSDVGDTHDPAGAVSAVPASSIPQYRAGGAAVAMGATGSDATSTSSGVAHNNMPPFQVIRFIVALVGVFPSEC